jgi:hypothetical protein
MKEIEKQRWMDLLHIEGSENRMKEKRRAKRVAKKGKNEGSEKRRRK